MPPTKTEGLPPEFAARNAILLDQRKGVRKNQHGIFKTHPVLALVGLGLGFVPLEPEHGPAV
jgi:hypothetical protein